MITMIYPGFIYFTALSDIVAYIQKKKKIVSSHCPATTAVKTSVSLQVQYILNAFFKHFGILS